MCNPPRPPPVRLSANPSYFLPPALSLSPCQTVVWAVASQVTWENRRPYIPDEHSFALRGFPPLFLPSSLLSLCFSTFLNCNIQPCELQGALPSEGFPLFFVLQCFLCRNTVNRTRFLHSDFYFFAQVKFSHSLLFMVTRQCSAPAFFLCLFSFLSLRMPCVLSDMLFVTAGALDIYSLGPKLIFFSLPGIRIGKCYWLKSYLMRFVSFS